MKHSLEKQTGNEILSERKREIGSGNTPDNAVATCQFDTLFMTRISLKQDLAASLNSYEAHHPHILSKS